MSKSKPVPSFSCFTMLKHPDTGLWHCVKLTVQNNKVTDTEDLSPDGEYQKFAFNRLIDVLRKDLVK